MNQLNSVDDARQVLTATNSNKEYWAGLRQKYLTRPSKKRYILRLVEEFEDDSDIEYSSSDTSKLVSAFEDILENDFYGFEGRNVGEITDSGEERTRDKLYVDDEASKNTALANILKEVFGGVILINGKKINIENFYENVNEESISLKGAGKNRTLEDISELITTPNYFKEHGHIFTDAEEEELAKRILLISEYADADREEKLGAKESTRELGDAQGMKVIRIRDTIKELMGWGKYHKVATRKNIYDSWSKVHGLHSTVVSNINKLVNAMPEGSSEIEQLKDELLASNKRFKKDGQYVIEFKPQVIAENMDDELTVTRKIITAYVEKELGIVIDSGSVSQNRDADEELVEDSLVTERVRMGAESRFNDSLDILGYFYVQNHLDGIFINELSLPNLKNITRKTMKEDFGFESEEKVAQLNKHLNRLQKVKPVKGEHFLPIYIIDDVRTRNIFSPFKEGNRNSKAINRTIEDLFDKLLNLLNEQRLRVGTSSTALRGQTFDEERGVGQSMYGINYSSISPVTRELGIKTEVDDVLSAIKEYFFEPLQDPKMRIGLDYTFSKNKSFTELLLLTSDDFAKARKKITRGLIESDGGNIEANDLTTILNFLKEVNKANIDIGEVVNKIKDLRQVYAELVDGDKELVDDYKEDMVLYLGTILLETNSNKGLKLYGKNPYDFAKNKTMRLNEVSAIMVIQDIFTDPNILRLLSKHSSKLKAIEQEISSIKKMDIENKILQVHDSLRILKGLPIYYGRGSLSSMDDLSEVIDVAKNIFDIDIVSTEIIKMVEEIDAFSNISKSVGVSEEVVYFVKANFR